MGLKQKVPRVDIILTHYQPNLPSPWARKPVLWPRVLEDSAYSVLITMSNLGTICPSSLLPSPPSPLKLNYDYARDGETDRQWREIREHNWLELDITIRGWEKSALFWRDVALLNFCATFYLECICTWYNFLHDLLSPNWKFAKPINLGKT